MPTTNPISPKPNGNGGPQPPSKTQRVTHAIAAALSEIASERMTLMPTLRCSAGAAIVMKAKNAVKYHKFRRRVLSIESQSGSILIRAPDD